LPELSNLFDQANLWRGFAKPNALTETSHKLGEGKFMIRKLKSGEYRLYSLKKNPKTGRRRNLGTFATLEKAKQHERAVQYFKKTG
jgi:hypothetical protein